MALITGKTLPTLTADRVALRWLTEEDVGSLYAIFSDPQVMRFWSSTPFEDETAARELVRNIHDSFAGKELFQWGVVRRDDDAVIGTCTLFRLDPDNRRAEIGYALGSAHWGRGYMNEALTTLLNFVFDELDLHRIEADVDPHNAASIRSLERLGFQREGYLRERWIIDGNLFDTVFYGLLRQEWAHRTNGQA